MFNKKNNNIKAEEYAKTMIDQLGVRKYQYHIDHKSDIKMQEKDFERLHDKLIPVFDKIIKNGNDFILTKDYLYYLSYLCLKMIDYQKELLSILNNLVHLDDKKLTSLYHKYFNDILFNKYIKEFDSIDSYVDRMEGDYKDAFLTLKSDSDNLRNIFIRGYEHEILDQISSLIFARCAKNGQLGLYNKLSRTYFTDPRLTIDYFSMNGFIDGHYDLVDEFDDYIYKDIEKINKNNNIIR